jgi:coniferyl-aldehyde dehydrogenase
MSELKPRSASRSDRERFGDVLALQRAAYLRDGAPSLTKRRSDLKKFKAAMLARRSAIEEAIDTDFGHRSRHAKALMEIVGVVQGIDYLARNLRRFMRPSRRIALDMRFGSNRIEYQPLGVVGVISPWNYPVNLSLMPVVTAIAAGNRVMLKPSKLTPATNAVLASMLGELFSEEQVAMVSGDGTAFSSLPFDHLVFTGSTAVGRAVMKAASENLVPVTLELGGKSPTIVAKGSVQDRTVSAIVWGKLLSGGQTCIAPDYALVHESEVNTFIESYDRLVKAAYPDGPTSEDYTSIVNDHNNDVQRPVPVNRGVCRGFRGVCDTDTMKRLASFVGGSFGSTRRRRALRRKEETSHGVWCHRPAQERKPGANPDGQRGGDRSAHSDDA